jgi:UDP-N-acetylmuramyl pentapeptide phosphotransferase/UDP-N-acetylglucosamine-1-phosphate transferase
LSILNYSLNGKLSLQIIPIIYLMIIENLNLNQLGGYDNFNLELNSFSTPFTLLAVIFLINTFNYFDGLDGTLSFTVIPVIIILYFLSSDQFVKLFLVILLLPLSIFLCFNFSIFKLPKLFLGDSGSLLLGFIIAFTLIYIANQNMIHPILLAWSISIFVYEFLSINLIRLQNNKNIFTAGLDHLHHILFKKNKSIFLTNFLISITNIILFSVGYISFKTLGPFISLTLFIIFFIFFYILRKKILYK